MIFKVDKDKDFFQMNPSAAAFEWLPKCSSREAKWICLTFDYDTPLRNIPLDQRKEVAAKMAGFLMEAETGRLDKNARNVITGKIEKVNEAVKEFMSVQYDDEKDLLQAYKEQIDSAKALMRKANKSDKEWSIAEKLVKSLPILISAKKDLETSLGLRDGKGDDSLENEPLSALDLFHEEDGEY